MLADARAQDVIKVVRLAIVMLAIIYWLSTTDWEEMERIQAAQAAADEEAY